MLIPIGVAFGVTIPNGDAAYNATACAFYGTDNVQHAGTVQANGTHGTYCTFVAGDVTILGPCMAYCVDAGGVYHFAYGDVIDPTSFGGLNAAGVRAAVGLAAANLDTQLAAIGPGLTAAGVRAAVGLAAANLDTQLAAIGPGLTQADVRTAVGLAAANLDTQLGTISGAVAAAAIRAAIGMAGANLDTQIATLSTLNAAGIRAAIGMAAANLDTQLAAIGPGLTAAGVRAAVGLAIANLDTQLATLAVPGSAMALTSGERNAVANALLDLVDAIEVGHTVRQALRLNSAVQGGIVSLGVGTAIFKGLGVGTTRLTATVPGDGTRPAMTPNL